jgi:hypothetical protein
MPDIEHDRADAEREKDDARDREPDFPLAPVPPHVAGAMLQIDLRAHGVAPDARRARGSRLLQLHGLLGQLLFLVHAAPLHRLG